MSAVDLFHTLAPNVPTPGVLVAAQQRHDAKRAIVLDAGGADLTSAAPFSTGGGPADSQSATPAVKPLACGTCTNWCDFSCWQCRECFSGDFYDWCLQNAYNGAYSTNNGSSDFGFGDVCSDQGSGQLSITSDKFSGNFSFGVQQEANAWSNDGDTCGFTDGKVIGSCDQNIRFDVSGSNIHVHFSGYYQDF